jgi:dCMP deaminase
MNRLTKSEYGCLLAISAASRSEGRNTKVGCAIEDKDGRIIATGYNGYAAGSDLSEIIPDSREARDYYIHAEVNALSLIERNKGVRLFCTHSPCLSCAQAIVAHGIKEVIYVNLHDTGDKKKHLTTFQDLFLRYNIKHRQIDEGEKYQILYWMRQNSV